MGAITEVVFRGSFLSIKGDCNPIQGIFPHCPLAFWSVYVLKIKIYAQPSLCKWEGKEMAWIKSHDTNLLFQTIRSGFVCQVNDFPVGFIL